VYNIVFTKQAAKTLQRIPHDVASLIREKLDEIANDPFASHSNSTKLQGHPGYRLRIGDWRIIYEVQKVELMIIVLKIARRGEAYR
jgi:mRNA interferase RelE/StbE